MDRIKLFEKEFLAYVDNKHPEIVEEINKTKELSDENTNRIKQAIEEFKENF